MSRFCGQGDYIFVRESKGRFLFVEYNKANPGRYESKMGNNIKTAFCYVKRRNEKIFSSKESADKFISFMTSLNNTYDNQNGVRSTYCPLCAGWHLSPIGENENALVNEDSQNVLFNLEGLINELKSSFEPQLWYVWQPRLEQAKKWLSVLEEDDSLSLYLVEAKRQLVHFDTIVKNKEKKIQTKTGRIKNNLTKAENTITQSINKFDIQGCLSLARQMVDFVNQKWFSVFDDEKQKYYIQLTENLNDESIVKMLFRIATIAKSLKLGIEYIPTDQLRALWKNMENLVSQLEEREVHPLLLAPFQKEVNRLEKQVNHRGVNYLDEKTGLDRVLVMLQKHYEYCNHKCTEAEMEIEKGDTMEALCLLQAAEETIRNIPLCREKADALQRIIDLTRKCI